VIWPKKLQSISSKERGASVVEAAMVLPLFFLLIFSIMEAGSFFLNISAVRTASREGAREASAAASSATADQTTLISAMRSLGQLSGSLDGIIIFKADSITSQVPQLCLDELESGGSGISGICNVYKADQVRTPEVTNFGATGTTPPGAFWDSQWPPVTRNDVLTPTVNPDYVGVYVQIKSAGATGLLPKRPMRAVNIFQIEPQRTDE
jgi:hypothetical protein